MMMRAKKEAVARVMHYSLPSTKTPFTIHTILHYATLGNVHLRANSELRWQLADGKTILPYCTVLHRTVTRARADGDDDNYYRTGEHPTPTGTTLNSTRVDSISG